MKRRVVVTGIGCVTPVGNDVATTWDSLLAGRSGGAPITQFDTTDFKVKFACEVKNFDPQLYMDRKEAKRTDRYTQLAMAAAVQAMADAFPDGSGYTAEHTGVVIGSGIGGIHTFEEQLDVYKRLGPSKISAFFVPMFIGDIASGVVSMRFQAKGPNYAVQSACATSGHAIGDSYRMIQYGDADVMICGGSEASVSPMAMGGFTNMQALSERNDSPATASRPFDATRDGFVLGEGSGILILEELEHAKRRGAKIYAELAGYGATGDAYHLTGQPDAHEGLQRAMKKAMADARMELADVQYINAHGTSTPLNDPNEIRGIKAVFGSHATALNVSSTKSATGHMLGAAGAVESIFTSLAITKGIIPPTINLQTADPECDLDCTANVPAIREVTGALSNSSGFGGHNVCIAIRRYQE